MNLLVHGRGGSDRDGGQLEGFVDLGSAKCRECSINVCGVWKIGERLCKKGYLPWGILFSGGVETMCHVILW